VQKQNLLSKLSKTDNFPVDWASRNDNGDFVLTSDVFRVTTTPSPLFGYNVRDFGAEYAEQAQENGGSFAEHDFGACFIKDKSLRKLNGRWCVDVSVDPTKCRYFNVQKMRVRTDDAGNEVLDESGNPIPLLDENGEVQISTTRQKEAFLTVELGMIEPDLSHDLAAPYVQTDSRTKSKIHMAERSDKAANRKTGSKGSSKGKRRRLSADQIAAVLSSTTEG
jgi:hypothetical protein